MAFAALISLHTTIRDLENSSHISLSPNSVSILPLAFKAINSLLKTMKLLDGSSKSFNRKNVNALDERIKAAVWKFEDLLDSHVYDQISPQSQILGSGAIILEVHVDEIRDDIESFIKMLEEFEKEYMYELDHLSPEEDVDVVSLDTDSGVKNCKLVGSSQILWFITSELEMKSSMEVVSLVGMAGIGKTALAKKIFDDFTGFEFECRAWVTIGRKWEPQKLRRDILIQLGEGNMKAKRCPIVLDDVWDNDVWDHFKRSLPTYIPRTILVLLTSNSNEKVMFHLRSHPIKSNNFEEENSPMEHMIIRQSRRKS